VAESKINMKTVLLQQSLEKKNNQENEKLQNQQFTKIWKNDVERGLQQERINNERVIIIIIHF